MKNTKWRVICSILVIMSMMMLVGCSSDSAGSDFPTETITLIVPAAAGSGLDITARALIECLDEDVEIVIVNMDGASMTTGTIEAYTADADGYTILINGNGGILIQPHMIDVPYTLDDFTHFTALVNPDPQALVVSADSDIESFEELKELLDSGERLLYTAANASGIGRIAEVAMLTALYNTIAEFVPFNGAAEAVVALLGGSVDFYVIDGADAVAGVESGQFKMLAVFDDERLENAPDVPTMAELGVDTEAYYGHRWLSVASDTPDEIVEWLKEAFDAAVATEEYQTYLEESCRTAVEDFTIDELTQLLNDESDRAYESLDALGMLGE